MMVIQTAKAATGGSGRLNSERQNNDDNDELNE